MHLDCQWLILWIESSSIIIVYIGLQKIKIRTILDTKDKNRSQIDNAYAHTPNLQENTHQEQKYSDETFWSLLKESLNMISQVISFYLVASSFSSFQEPLQTRSTISKHTKLNKTWRTWTQQISCKCILTRTRTVYRFEKANSSQIFYDDTNVCIHCY